MASPSPLRAFAKDSVWTVLQQGSTALCTLATSMVVARSLGPTGQGVYGVGFTLAVLSMTFGNLGIGPATVYHVGAGTFAPVQAARANAVLALGLGLAAAGVLGGVHAVAGARLLPGVPGDVVGVAALLVPLFLLSNFLTAVLQGMHAFGAYNIASFLVPAITLVATVVGVGLGHGGVVAALTAQGVGHAGAALYAGAVARRSAPAAPTQGYLRQVTGYGIRAYFGNALAYLNYRLDMFLLNAWLNAAAVGIYSIAVSVGERLWLLSFATSAMLLPRVARREAQSETLTPIIARQVFAATLVAAAALAAIAPWAVPWIFGSPFAAAVAPLYWLIPGLVACSLSRVLSADLAGRGHPGINAALGGVALVSNVAANAVLIPRWGASGAAAASSLAYTLECMLKLAVYCRRSGVALAEVMVVQRQDLQRLVAAWRQRGA